MTPLADPSDFVSSPYDEDVVEGAIDWATSVIAAYCNRNFDLVTGDQVTVTPTRGAAFLPETPVVSVTSVHGYLPGANGMTWTALTNYQWVAATGLIYDTTGLPGTNWNVGPSWPWLPGSLRVVYSHGYAEPPADLRNVCVRLAQQYCENPTLMISRKVGDIETRYSSVSGAPIGPMDKAVLDRYAHVGVS